MRRLFCFDFDKTLVKGHLHNAMVQYANSGGEKFRAKVAELIKDPDVGLRNPKEIVKLMRKIWANGHHIAIVSFTQFSQMVQLALQELGLSNEEMKLVDRQCFPPEKEYQVWFPGKNFHLLKSMKEFDISDPTQVLLIDDSEINIKAAKQAFYATVQVVEDDFEKTLGEIESFIFQEQ